MVKKRKNRDSSTNRSKTNIIIRFLKSYHPLFWHAALLILINLIWFFLVYTLTYFLVKGGEENVGLLILSFIIPIIIALEIGRRISYSLKKTHGNIEFDVYMLIIFLMIIPIIEWGIFVETLAPQYYMYPIFLIFAFLINYKHHLEEKK
ncbi:hypothetical protein ACFL1H_04195 [Nanoarchaeota archaeon]